MSDETLVLNYCVTILIKAFDKQNVSVIVNKVVLLSFKYVDETLLYKRVKDESTLLNFKTIYGNSSIISNRMSVMTLFS